MQYGLGQTASLEADPTNLASSAQSLIPADVKASKAPLMSSSDLMDSALTTAQTARQAYVESDDDLEELLPLAQLVASTVGSSEGEGADTPDLLTEAAIHSSSIRSVVASVAQPGRRSLLGMTAAARTSRASALAGGSKRPDSSGPVSSMNQPIDDMA